MSIQFPGSLSSLAQIPKDEKDDKQIELALRASPIVKIFTFIFSRWTLHHNGLPNPRFLESPSSEFHPISNGVPDPAEKPQISWTDFVQMQDSDTFILEAIYKMNELRNLWISPQSEAPYRFSGNEAVLKTLQDTAIGYNSFPPIEENTSFADIADLIKSFLREVKVDISEKARKALITHFVDILENTLYYQSQHGSPIRIFMDNFPELQNPRVKINEPQLFLYIRQRKGVHLLLST